MGPLLGLQLSVGIAAFGCGLCSAEHLTKIKEFRKGGLCGPLIHLDSKLGRGKLGTSLQCPGFTAVVLVLRLLAATDVLIEDFFWSGGISITSLWILVLSGAWITWRRRVGGDGGEQMMNIVLIASTIGLTFSSMPSVGGAAGTFIALQSCLAYFAAGMAKLLSSIWRSGDAIRGIVNTHTHGSHRLFALLTRHPRLSVGLNWGLIGAETAFPLVLIVPKEFCVLVLTLGFLFHLSNAVVMGLNNFVWAFLATYPCIYVLRDVVGAS
jgi:hypothetical protein